MADEPEKQRIESTDSTPQVDDTISAIRSLSDIIAKLDSSIEKLNEKVEELDSTERDQTNLIEGLKNQNQSSGFLDKIDLLIQNQNRNLLNNLSGSVGSSGSAVQDVVNPYLGKDRDSTLLVGVALALKDPIESAMRAPMGMLSDSLKRTTDQLAHTGGFLGQISGLLPIISTALTTLSGVAFIGAILAIKDSADTIKNSVEFQRAFLRTQPSGNYNRLTELGNPYQDTSNFYNTLRPALPGDVDLKNLIASAMASAPRGGFTSGSQLQTTAYSYGLLAEQGLDPRRAAGLSQNMNQNLLMGVNQSNFGLFSLATTAKQHSLDIGDYSSKVIEMTKNLRTFGLTILSVDKEFRSFREAGYSNGIGITSSAAMDAARQGLELQRNLSIGQSAYLALTEASNLTSLGSGIAGGPRGSGGMSLGDMARMGPSGAYLAANLLRTTNVPGASTAIQDQVLRISEMQMGMMNFSGMSSDAQQSAKRFVVGDTLNKLGIAKGEYGKDEGFTALVDKFASGEIGKMTSSAFKQTLKELTPKTLPELFADLQTNFKTLLNPTFDEIKNITSVFDNVKDIINNIRSTLIGVILPILEKAVIAIVGISSQIIGEDPKTAMMATRNAFRTMNSGMGYNMNPTISALGGQYFNLSEMPDDFSSEQSSSWLNTAIGTGLGMAVGGAVGGIPGAIALGGAGGYMGSKYGKTKSKLNPREIQMITAMAGRLGMDPSHLLAIMSLETGGTFSPSIRNKQSGATGLIQFMPSTARGLGTSTNALSQMSVEQQLKYVEKYLRPYKGKMNTLSDAYAAVFTPAALGRGLDDTVWSSMHGKAYSQNIGLDINRDGRISKRELGESLKRGGHLSKAQQMLASSRSSNSEVEVKNVVHVRFYDIAGRPIENAKTEYKEKMRTTGLRK